MNQAWLYFGAVVIGWIGGGLVNWAADVLPGWHPDGSRPDFGALWRDRAHYWVLAWRPNTHCSRCRQTIGWRSPAVMASAIVLALLVALRARSGIELVVVWFYAFFLLAVTVIDLEHRRVLNIMLAPMAVIAAVFSLLPFAPEPLAMALGGVVGLGLFLVLGIIGRGALGMGDIKLAGVIGIMVGYPGVLYALIAGALLGGVAAVVLLVTRKATRKTAIAYAPYLSLGAIIILWLQLGS
jgi:leader peptidase (prepilin peptidase)/N-methyltransferase